MEIVRILTMKCNGYFTFQTIIDIIGACGTISFGMRGLQRCFRQFLIQNAVPIFFVHLLNIYHLLSQVYPLAKFQPHMPITFIVTAPQSSNNRKNNLYSKYRENKLQAFTKTVVTYKRIDIWS